MGPFLPIKLLLYFFCCKSKNLWKLYCMNNVAVKLRHFIPVYRCTEKSQKRLWLLVLQPLTLFCVCKNTVPFPAPYWNCITTHMGSSFLCTGPNQTLIKILWENMSTSLSTHSSPVPVKCVKHCDCVTHSHEQPGPPLSLFECACIIPQLYPHKARIVRKRKKTKQLTAYQQTTSLLSHPCCRVVLTFCFLTPRHAVQQHWPLSKRKEAYIFFHACCCCPIN